MGSTIFTELTTMFGTLPVPAGYWEGPYGILVPNEIVCVRARDGCNTLFKSGGETERASFEARPRAFPCEKVSDPLTERGPLRAEYLKKYATLGNDGRYYWKKQIKYM